MVIKLLGENHPKIVQLRLSIADTFVSLDRLDEALEQEKQALILTKELGGD